MSSGSEGKMRQAHSMDEGSRQPNGRWMLEMEDFMLGNGRYTLIDNIRQRRIIKMFHFVETQLFTRLVQEYLSDDDYAQLQQTLMANPRIGELIPGTGRVRKILY